MRIETHIERQPIFEEIKDEFGEVIDTIIVGYQEISITDIYANEGKVLIEKASGRVMSDHITLGTDDSVENYDEIPLAEAE